jgi:hypothetical protein
MRVEGMRDKNCSQKASQSATKRLTNPLSRGKRRPAERRTGCKLGRKRSKTVRKRRKVKDSMLNVLSFVPMARKNVLQETGKAKKAVRSRNVPLVVPPGHRVGHHVLMVVVVVGGIPLGIPAEAGTTNDFAPEK